MVTEAAVALFASTGLYETLHSVLVWGIVKQPCLKRFWFGGDYLEDTWVGFYEDSANERFLLIENFEQDFEGITVKGQSFDDTGAQRAQWESAPVDFDQRKGTLSYHYTCHIMSAKVIEQGVTAFHIERDGHKGRAERLRGYSTDSPDGNRSPSWEKQLQGRNIALATALDEAKRYRDVVLSARGTTPVPNP